MIRLRDILAFVSFVVAFIVKVVVITLIFLLLDLCSGHRTIAITHGFVFNCLTPCFLMLAENVLESLIIGIAPTCRHRPQYWTPCRTKINHVERRNATLTRPSLRWPGQSWKNLPTRMAMITVIRISTSQQQQSASSESVNGPYACADFKKSRHDQLHAVVCIHGLEESEGSKSTH